MRQCLFQFKLNYPFHYFVPVAVTTVRFLYNFYFRISDLFIVYILVQKYIYYLTVYFSTEQGSYNLSALFEVITEQELDFIWDNFENICSDN